MAKDGDILERLKMMPGYEVDELVERSLYHLAVGYNVNAEKIFYNRRTGEVVRVPYIKHVPPDVRAAVVTGVAIPAVGPPLAGVATPADTDGL